MGAFVKTPMIKRVLSVALAAAFIGVLSGCASTANNPKDPYEGFNRAMFSVNEGFDVVLKPVAEGYDAAAPLPVKAGIGNFFGNISDAWTAINNFLQGKGGEGLSDVGRVLVNTTLGIGGVFDVASEMGLEKHAEDFGQTMAVWGVPEGNYLYWPLIVLRSNDLMTPPLGLAYFADSESGANYGALMATSVLLSAPLLVGFLLAQRQFIRGITMTGVK